MSKIGKIPVKIPPGVTLTLRENRLTATGPQGSQEFLLPEEISLFVEPDQVLVKPKSSQREIKALHGLVRAKIANLLTGVSTGFSKTLELSGVGFRAQVQKEELILNLGFSQPKKICAPPGISFAVSEGKIKVFGIDKEAVGEVAAKIRQIRPADPYKGKGIKYEGEKIRKKAGKAAKAVGALGR